MAESTSNAVDVPALIAYGDDLISLMKNKKEINGLIHSLDGAKKLLSSCQADNSDLKIQMQVVNDEVNDLEHQREIIEEQKRKLWKLEKDELRKQKKLSMYASVTNIIPDSGDESRISGRVVQRDKKIVEEFDFGPAKGNTYEICNGLWKIMDI